MDDIKDQQDKWEKTNEHRQDQWENIITDSVKSLERTAADLKVAMQASKDNIERVFDSVAKCQDSRDLYRGNIEEMLKEQKEFNKDQKDITKRFDEQINGEKGLFTTVSVQNKSIENLVESVKDVKALFLTLTVFMFTTGLGYILARIFKLIP